MIRIALLLASLALLAQAPPPSASPTELYHAGAQAFIDGDDAAALRAVDAGLARAPDDAKLHALRDLIDPPEQDDQDDGGGESDESQEPDESDAGDEGEPSAPDNPADEAPDAEQDATQTDPGEAQPGEAPAQPEGRAPEPMSRAQAERILDAVGSEEELLLRELRHAPTQRSRSEKDW